MLRRRIVVPRRSGATAPEGWYWPSGVLDNSLPIPDVLLPKKLLLWDLKQDKKYKYGITNSPHWVADDHLATFTGLKNGLQDFAEFYGCDFNSQRRRDAQTNRTLQSECALPAWILYHHTTETSTITSEHIHYNYNCVDNALMPVQMTSAGSKRWPASPIRTLLL